MAPGEREKDHQYGHTRGRGYDGPNITKARRAECGTRLAQDET
jgi:hypothetical protein